MLTALSRLKQHIVHIIPAITYFFIAFSLINLTLGLMLGLKDYEFFTYVKVALMAVIVGKLLLIVDSFTFVNRFPNKPLIYNIVWRMIIYNIAAILFRVAEFYFHHLHSVGEAQQIESHMLHAPFWAAQMWILMVFLGYVIFTEFARVLGSKKIKEMIFG